MSISPIQVISLQAEHATNPLGIEASHPALSWRFEIDSEERGLFQKGYQILVASQIDDLEPEKADMWDSSFIVSDEHTSICYQGQELQSGARYFWKVRIRDGIGRNSEWSQAASWSMGLLRPNDWQAKWIGLTEPIATAWTPEGVSPGTYPMPLLRHEFEVGSAVIRATAYICGLGQFDLHMNGDPVTDNVLEPGWTDYDHTCMYCTYDVTEHIRSGRNAIGIMLGNGFYNITGDRYKKFKDSYGLPKAIMQLELELVNGDTILVTSGPEWEMAPGPISFSCVYGGEDYDARMEKPGWDKPYFKPTGDWDNAALVTPPTGKLRSYPIPPNKVMKRYEVKHISETVPDVRVYDFGVNFSGRPHLRVKGTRGTTIKLIPGELLDDQGKVSQEYTGAPQSFSYTLKGEEEEVWYPRFSYSGFRYIQIEIEDSAITDCTDTEQAPMLTMLELLGEMIYPDLTATGSFECSREDWNGIHKLIMQAVLSNVKSVLTDCPHREKLGWLEEYHLMGPSIMYNYDLSALYLKMFEDMREAQTTDGLVPSIAPQYVVFEDGFVDSPEWGSAYIIAPWYYYKWYKGNIRVLSDHYDSMKHYMDYLYSKSSDHIVRHGLGDWGNVWQNLDGASDQTPLGITATATYYYDCILMSKIASVLGKEQDAYNYEQLANEVKRAFEQEWFNVEHKHFATGTQTSNSSPLAVGLTTPDTDAAAIEALIEDLKQRDYAITSGEIGHRFTLLALTRKERSDIIQKMLEQTKKPYYAYQVAHGASSLTEYWDGPTDGHSQNHFMMGHIEEWFYSALAGISIDYDGTKEYELLIKPYLAEGVEWVNASQILPQGNLDVQWNKGADGTLSLHVTIPVSSSVVIAIPTANAYNIKENGILLTAVRDLELIEEKDGHVYVRVGSGTYSFHSALKV
ncbi:alpha-L-rhamnosidase [Paenibacillus glycanilyticus]|uniref:alpha-L-rhamnosidase n=1 Tax=Paenibacillus glycanilyticus TaxID=126569 RepID=A0ABQ6GBW8_9BACL|nr:alpha-L-rhamnosidase [Paenibacillus glycanilyticus]GLX68449.1 hydrolase [Paenibacillus glycanilyticus]